MTTKRTSPTTPPTSQPDPTTPVDAPDAATNPVTPITSSIPAGQKSPALDLPPGWLGTRAVIISPDGKEFAVLCSGHVHQGMISTVAPLALTYGYAKGVQRKIDADNADKTSTKGAETITRLTGDLVDLEDWCPPRTSGPREETATPLDLQIKTQIVVKLNDPATSAALKTAGVKRTGLTGPKARLFARYREMMAAIGKVAPDEKWTKYCGIIEAEATKALAEAAKTGADPWE